MTEPAETAVRVLPEMVAQVRHAEDGSMLKITGLPEAPPVAESTICWPASIELGGVKPVMVCGRIADAVAVPDREIGAEEALDALELSVEVPVTGPAAVPTAGVKTDCRMQYCPGLPAPPPVHLGATVDVSVKLAFEGAVNTGVPNVAGSLPVTST